MIRITKPKRRNGQVRLYWRLLQFSLAQKIIANTAEARQLLDQFQAAKSRVEKNSRDQLTDVDVDEMVEAAQNLLKFVSMTCTVEGQAQC